jgi:hypothetical protein
MRYEFERAAEGAARDRAKRAVLNAIGYEEERSPPPRFDEQAHFWIFYCVIPFLTWVAKVCATIFFLLVMSIGSYAMIRGLIMRGLDVRSHKIFFDYSPSAEESLMPMGIVDLRSTRNAPWFNSCAESLDRSSPAEHVCINDDNQIIYRVGGDQDSNVSENAVLESGKRYFFELSLALPESDVNKRLGVFMVKVELRSADWSLLALSKQHSFLPFESALVSLFRKTMIMLPLTSGILSEARTITLQAFDQYKDVNDEKPVSIVEISLGVPMPAAFPATVQAIQIQSAELRYGKEMNSIQAFFHNWHYFCAITGTIALFWGYTLVALSILNRRSARHRWNTQPYASFFDSDDEESGNDARSASQDQWMGADIEILDDDENDSSAWEPITSIEERTKNGNLNEEKNLVSEDDKSVPAKQNKSLERKGEQSTVRDEPLFAEMPHGKEECKHGLSDENCRDAVESRMKRAQRKEEQRLADMVMKGLFLRWCLLLVCVKIITSASSSQACCVLQYH